MRIGRFLMPIWVILLGVACSKSSEEGLLYKDVRNRQINSSVSNLSYGEDVFYVRDQNKNGFIAPVNKPSFSGHFTAIPSGLAIDRQSGSIDLQKSEPGQAYKIFYVDDQGKLRDSARIVISGIGYQDGIYDLQGLKGGFDGNINADYNAGNKVPQSLTNSFWVSDANGSLSNNLAKQLKINRFTGEIRLRESKDEGYFSRGNSKGFKDIVELRYRISDRSGRRQNSIQVILHYYPSESDVPADLKEIIAERKRIMDRVNAMPSSGVERKNSEDLLPGDFLTEESISDYNKPVRPPLIIIVG